MGFQNSWGQQPARAGPGLSLTLFLGGQTALEERQRLGRSASRFLPPRSGGRVPWHDSGTQRPDGRALFARQSLVRAGYACFFPGQWTTIAGTEILPVGNILFRGGAVQLRLQGYIDGGAQTGRVAEMVKQRVHA